MRIYAGEIADTNMRANLVDPGPLRTRLRAAGFPREDRPRCAFPEDATEPFLALAAAAVRRQRQPRRWARRQAMRLRRAPDGT